MVTPKEWSEFQKTGLLLFINQILHVFGWAIVIKNEEGVISAFPARVTYRGFEVEDVSESYTKITKYLNDNINELTEEVQK